jgi:hypothetical protein
VLEEAETNLLASFRNSQKTKHRGLAGNARAKSIADFLTARLPNVYGVATGAEVVDYADRRSGEIDIVIYDKQRNALVSTNPLWFTLAGQPTSTGADDDQLRCLRTVFAFGTNLGTKGWLDKEWVRVKNAAAKASVPTASIDRILVLDRGMLNPPSQAGVDQFVVSSVFQQWVINLVNFLARENSRREPWDWQSYAKKTTPGWRAL